MVFYALSYHDLKKGSGLVEPLQKINPHAEEFGILRERQAVTTTDTAKPISRKGRGGRILRLNIKSERDFRLASDHISFIKLL